MPDHTISAPDIQDKVHIFDSIETSLSISDSLLRLLSEVTSLKKDHQTHQVLGIVLKEIKSIQDLIDEIQGG